MKCACGCPLPARPNGRYATDACRAKDWKRRTGYGRPAPRKGRANANRRAPKPSDVRFSYDAVVSMVEQAMRRDAPIHVEREARELVIEHATKRQFERIKELGL